MSQQIIIAPRDDTFKIFLTSLLQRGGLEQNIIDNILQDSRCFKLFSNAFTHLSADPLNNYEFLEKLGDATVNKIIRYYIIMQFPELHNKEGVEYISLLETKWKSTSCLYSFAQKLNIKQFISADKDYTDIKVRTTSEDIFEAIVGAMELSINLLYPDNYGYNICYNFVVSLLKDINIKYTYEQLLNSKSRLNELVLGVKDVSMKIEYKTKSEITSECRVFVTNIYINGKLIGCSDDLKLVNEKYIQGTGVSYPTPFRLKIASEMAASEVVIYNLIKSSKLEGNEHIRKSVMQMAKKKKLCPFSNKKI